MIRHHCRKRPLGSLIFFSDPGETASDIVGAVTYQRPSVAVGMDCPICGAAVPYKIRKDRDPMMLDISLPLFEEVTHPAVTADGGIIEIPEPL